MTLSIESLITHFDVPGDFRDAHRIGSGHINDTYRVDMLIEDLVRPFTLQRINHHVFNRPDELMENVMRVTNHIRRKKVNSGCADVDRRVLEVIPTIQGRLCYRHGDDTHWRMYAYIDNAHTVADDPSTKEIYEAAYGFGNFLALLSDLSGPQLAETIPNFHCGMTRYAALNEAIERDPCGRASEVRAEIDYIADHEWLLAEPKKLIENGALPLRAAHNDTKASNVLLDDETNRVLCVIDLDTVMPGLALYDFGDLVRTTASGTAEDTRDLSQVQVRLERLDAATSGFLSGAQNLLEAAEVESLYLGPSYMALIMATRFLTDYLLGDVYYKVNRPKHNLDRCRAQLALTGSLLGCGDKLASLLHDQESGSNSTLNSS